MAQAGPEILAELFRQIMEGVGLDETYKEQVVPFLLDIISLAVEHVTGRQVDERTLERVKEALISMNFRRIAYELAVCGLSAVDWNRVANIIIVSLRRFWEKTKEIFAKVVAVGIEFGEFVYNGATLVLAPIARTAKGIWDWFTNILAGLAQFIGNFVFGSDSGEATRCNTNSAKEMAKYL